MEKKIRQKKLSNGIIKRLLLLKNNPRLFMKIAGRRIADIAGAIMLRSVYRLKGDRGLNERFLNYFQWRYMIQLYELLPTEQYVKMANSIFKADEAYIRMKAFRGEKIKICFIVYTIPSWGGDTIYDLLCKDGRFEVMVLVVRFNYLGMAESENYNKTKIYFADKGYNVYSPENAGWQESDIYIYQHPYVILTDDQINIGDQPLSKLCVITPYDLTDGSNEAERHENDHFWRQSRCIWRFYCYTQMHYSYGIKANRLGKQNMRFSGYPKMDTMYEQPSGNTNWKGNCEKRILFAPSMASNDNNRFKEYMKPMLKIAREYKEISWIFRPHPGLGASLASSGFLESSEFEAYLDEWRALPNGEVNYGGEYEDTFKTSDALIGDAGAFLTNYQYMDKPLLCLCKKNELSEYGKALYSVIYVVDDNYEKGIKDFIQKVVLGGEDSKRKKRRNFFKEILDYRSINGKMASEYVYEDIVSVLEDIK